MNYFTDYVTHLICGKEPEETDLSDANDLYEIPAVTIKWIEISIKLKRLVDTKPYSYKENRLFAGLTFCLSGLREDRSYLWALVTYNGGSFQLNLSDKCTHLITTTMHSEMYMKAESLGPEKITVVTPDWILESVRNNMLVQAEQFHPRRIAWPRTLKYESTTAITGFEPDPLEQEEKQDEITSSSTQALLDKLKQRMPWNQPQSAAEGPPPNVVAPSFNKSQQNLMFQQQLQKQKQNLLQQSQELQNLKGLQSPSQQPSQQSQATSQKSQQQKGPKQAQQQQQMIQQQRQHTLSEQQQIQNIQQQLQASTLPLTQVQVPKTVVHHTPQQLFNQQQTKDNLNRLLGQLSQQRPRVGQQGQLVQQLRNQLVGQQQTFQQQKGIQQFQQQNQQGMRQQQQELLQQIQVNNSFNNKFYVL